MRNDLNFGARAGRIVARLGPPMVKTETSWKYQGTSDQVTFHIRRGVIEKIELQYYFD
jgi:hypothetical protein